MFFSSSLKTCHETDYSDINSNLDIVLQWQVESSDIMEFLWIHTRVHVFHFNITNFKTAPQIHNHRPVPPRQGGDLLTCWPDSSHCTCVFATMERACTPFSSSSFKTSLTKRCLFMSGIPSKLSLITTTLKWVSEPFGTLCFELSFMTSKCWGWNLPVSFLHMEFSIGFC